jgi:hypothetical protein
MSCPTKNRIFNVQPEITETMKKKNQVYVWKEVMGNPNMYCWVPISKKLVNPMDLDVQEVNIQDIPPEPNFDDIISQISERAERDKQNLLLKKLDSPDVTEKEMVSVDNPDKYPIVKKFIKDRKLKVYGGAAINAYLPREDKFYNPRDIPDYDIYSPNPWDDAVELANILYRKGYKYVEARAGIHKGTYKVFANFWPAVDISFMNKKEFDMIKTHTIDGIKIVYPFKLLESMYREFSAPYSDPSRWPKVAVREKLLVKWTQPLSKKFKCSKDLFSGGKIKIHSTLVALLEISYRFIKRNKLIFTGPIAYNTYIEIGGGDKRVVTSSYQVLTEHAQKNSEEIFTIMMSTYKHLEITTHMFPSREINNTAYRIYAVIDNKHHLICTFIQITMCVPYQYVLGRHIVSIDYLKYDLLNTIVFGENINNAKCMLQYLTNIQISYYTQKNIYETDLSPFRRFITKCRGPVEHSVKVSILNQWLEKQIDRKSVITTSEDGYHIRKYPQKEVPKECQNLSKDVCKYPCAWNSFIGKCQAIPGMYRPGSQVV